MNLWFYFSFCGKLIQRGWFSADTEGFRMTNTWSCWKKRNKDHIHTHTHGLSYLGQDGVLSTLYSLRLNVPSQAGTILGWISEQGRGAQSRPFHSKYTLSAAVQFSSSSSSSSSYQTHSFTEIKVKRCCLPSISTSVFGGGGKLTKKQKRKEKVNSSKNKITFKITK